MCSCSWPARETTVSKHGSHLVTLGGQGQQRCFANWLAPYYLCPGGLGRGLGHSGTLWGSGDCQLPRGWRSCCSVPIGTSWESGDLHQGPELTLTVLSALVFSSPTYLLILLSHTKPPLHSPLPSSIPFPAFVLYDAVTWVRKLIKVIIPCTEMCLSSHSYLMFLPLDLLMLFNS